MRGGAALCSGCHCVLLCLTSKVTLAATGPSSRKARLPWAVLLTSPKAVRLTTGLLVAMVAVVYSAGLDLLRVCKVLLVGAFGLIFSSP